MASYDRITHQKVCCLKISQNEEKKKFCVYLSWQRLPVILILQDIISEFKQQNYMKEEWDENTGRGSNGYKGPPQLN